MQKDQKKVLKALELELQMAVCIHVGATIEPGFTTRTASALNP